eukprot:scaffold14557_cov67-Attheya_sp.AAC.5
MQIYVQSRVASRNTGTAFRCAGPPKTGDDSTPQEESKTGSDFEPNQKKESEPQWPVMAVVVWFCLHIIRLQVPSTNPSVKTQCGKEKYCFSGSAKV